MGRMGWWMTVCLLCAACSGHRSGFTGDAGPDAHVGDLGTTHDFSTKTTDLSGAQDGGCGLRTCASVGAMCGPIGDGCGAIINCGTCPTGESCVMGHCKMGSMCTPQTCASQSFNCGMAGDGCGNIINCGSCASAVQTCGGGGQPNVCGRSCTNLCLQQVTCDGGSTTISGTVLAPTNSALGYGAPDPLPNALVYVPNGTVMAFSPMVSCDACGAQVTGSPLVSVNSGTDGTFILPNAPCGTNIPLVIQLGRWRRHIVIPSVACCANTALTADQTRFPRTQAEGGDPLNNIPSIAVQTGAVDPIECILPKIGIDVSQFSNPGGAGRVQLFQGTGCAVQGRRLVPVASGATIDATTPLAANALWPSPTTLASYDAVIAACVDCEMDAVPGANISTPTNQTNVMNYVNSGGRLFASHFSYIWLYNLAPFSGTAAWMINQPWSLAVFPSAYPPNTQSFTADIDTSFPKGMQLATWLNAIGAATGGQLPVYQVRHDFNSVVAPSQRWFSVDPLSPGAGNYASIPLEYTFNAPVGSSSQCGRVLFSDFHVSTNGSGAGTFPGECGAAAPMTPQERVLEFMIFDLTSCVRPDVPTCTPRACPAPLNCGALGDGCGGIVQCGTCPTGQTCGAVTPNVCGTSTMPCTPQTCRGLGYDCGAAGDGCGGVIQCGTCPAGQTCGFNGIPNVCGGIG